jgi:hypothetical protein
VLQRLEDNIFPWIGANAIRDVTSADIISCIDRMAEGGKHETARRVLQITKRIFKWAIGRGLVGTSPAAHIDPREQLPSKKVKHRAAIKDPLTLGSLNAELHSALVESSNEFRSQFLWILSVVTVALRPRRLSFTRRSSQRLRACPERSRSMATFRTGARSGCFGMSIRTGAT